MNNYDNLSRYRIFLEVADYGSISKAAEHLYISQPAVSMTIKKLEENLSATLFIRKTRGVALTEEGKLLYDCARIALYALADAEEKLKQSKNTGRLRIAASNVLCKYILMPYLEKFTKKYPDTDVSITCTSSSNAHAMLEECSIDLALMAKPDNIGTMSYYSLGEIEDIFVCTPAYLKRLDCKMNDVFKYGNIMLLNKSNVSRMHVNNYYAENNINPAHILEVNEMDMLIEFAKIGIGISCVVKQFVKNELLSGSLIEIQLPKPISAREIGFLYNENIQPINENILKLININ
ncbi:MAG: LysR family transcriptional regulator [Clostridia bacterium]|jgi:DNA-binding transcriptional LysR family regulator|nr:LysR family transcriptional regulator [Clostridia bacterium]MCI9086285.1 LysR family transcriptional regulator [Clostridia bacterium]NDO19355.1 LysR family transcriptional regulator [Lachnospiraceae bacterium MD329]